MATQIAPDASTQAQSILVELDLRNVSNERQDVEGKWDSSACLWVDDKPHRASLGFRIMVDRANADSVSQRLRSTLKAGETMGVEVNLAPGVTVSRTLARTDFESSRWNWYLDPGRTIRVGLRFPSSVPRTGTAELESTGVRQRVTLPPSH